MPKVEKKGGSERSVVKAMSPRPAAINHALRRIAPSAQSIYSTKGVPLLLEHFDRLFADALAVEQIVRQRPGGEGRGDQQQ